MPYQLVEEYCGKWWHYWWAGPLTYIHLVDLGAVSPEFCEYVLPGNLLELRRGSIPVACLPLTYRESEGVWVYNGKSYTKVENLAAALEKAVEDYPHWCRWRPAGKLPPSILDEELLEEALWRMPVLRPAPEELAVDFVAWSYERDVAAFLHSEYVHLTSSSRFEERWREICPEGDPRQCYSGGLGEILASFKERGQVPAVDSVLFGRRFARPWGAAPVYLRTERGATRIYYVLGRLLREVIQRKQAIEGFYKEEEAPLPSLSEYLDVQGPLMRKIRRRRPEPFAPIETDFFPTSDGHEERGDPFAAFYTDL